MSENQVYEAIKLICKEKGISEEAVIATIESALAAAYRKDFGNKLQNIKVNFDPKTNQIKVFDVKTVVEDLPLEVEVGIEENKEGIKETKKEERKEVETEKEVAAISNEADGEEALLKKRFNPKTDLQLKDALAVKKDAKVGEEIVTPLEVPGTFGRMAAQTAKQVIIQKIKEAERETIYEEYKNKEGEVVIGAVQRREGRVVLIDLGRTTGLLLPEEQIEMENYRPGDRLKVYVMSVNISSKGPEIFVSRAHPNIVKKLFELEIPEIANGTVQIKDLAREAGYRSKVAVWTDQENIDPIGSCIGQRGARVQTIISELKGEKIDIIEYDDNPVKFIANALAPAKISGVKLDENNKTALVTAPEDQLSLAIGRAGQNVRLAVKLTGWKIDIVPAGQVSDKQQAISDGEVSGLGQETSDQEVSDKEQEISAQGIKIEAPAVEEKSEKKKEKKPKKEKKEKADKEDKNEEAKPTSSPTIVGATAGKKEKKPKKEKTAKKSKAKKEEEAEAKEPVEKKE